MLKQFKQVQQMMRSMTSGKRHEAPARRASRACSSGL